jgi:hypothetical protein
VSVGDPELLTRLHDVSAALADLGERVLAASDDARDVHAIEEAMVPLHDAFDALVHAAIGVVASTPKARGR